MKFEWESLDEYNFRARVFGGWIVKTLEDTQSTVNNYGGPNQWEFRVATVFVPDIHNDWAITK